tara:strand:- start:155 stop:703 length:549 start_codon:yes stop_codon:yes gene_type:complete
MKLLNKNLINNNLKDIFDKYKDSFSKKKISTINTEDDLIMKAFGKKQADVDINKQYWNREFGKYFEYTVVKVFELTHDEFKPGLRLGADEVCDLIIGDVAIDVKYRVGSGDSGTLKKFKQYGKLLKDKGYKPIMLFLRDDNLKSAVTAINKGGWIIKSDKAMFDYILKESGFDLKSFLINIR